MPFCMLIGAFLNAYLGVLDEGGILPFPLDTIFTSVGAAVFGPEVGIACAAITALFSEILFGFAGLNFPFVVSGIAVAAIVGIFARKGFLSTFSETLVCLIAVIIADSFLSSLVGIFFLQGWTGCEMDYYVSLFSATGMSAFEASVWARASTDLIDKGISVFLAFISLRYVTRSGLSTAVR
jgi:energy-coupling factor transport system substrate-specific component